MNCLQFRRLVETSPDTQDPEFLRHKAECGDCASLAARVARFDAALSNAVRIDPPENLASRILLKQSFSTPRAMLPRRRLVALAASMVAVAGLALAGNWYLKRGDELGQEVVSLVRNASYAMSSETLLDSKSVAMALAPVGLRLKGKISGVTFAGQCLLRNTLAGHLVLQGEKAPITIFLMPDVRISARSVIKDPMFRGELVPLKKGSMAIVGAPGEELAPVLQQIRFAVGWLQA